MDQDHYWFNGERIPLLPNPGKQYLLLESPDMFSHLLKEIAPDSGTIPEVKQVQMGLLDRIETTDRGLNNTTQRFWTVLEDGMEERLKRTLTERNEGIVYRGPAFYSQSGKELILTHIFYIKLKDVSDINMLFQMAMDYKVYVEGRNAFMPEWFVLSCDNKSNGNALEMANSFYETGLFASAEPDLMEDMLIQCVNDTYFPQQWALQNTGQSEGTAGSDIKMCQAWQISQGSPAIIVAIVDQGFELNHPDFSNISAVSFDSESGTSPSQVLGDHGTACAGIIGAAANNNLGVAGIAPNVTLMSVSNSLSGAPNSRMKRADAINFARTNGAAVISNSWGSSVQYQVINDAISLALSAGRGGLGCIVVFASGNDSQGSISYPSDLPGVIAVGATDSNDLRAYFSNYGTGLDISAPGVDIYTTDRQGTNGYNPSPGPAGDYFANFTGTSAAAPHVAAVAALVLSVNNSLSYAQVISILTGSAEKVGGYSYNADGWSAELGYGRLNACAALNRTRFTISGSDHLCTSSNYTVNGLPSGVTAVWSSSNQGVATISATGNATKVSNGQVTFSATVNIPNGCGTVVISKEVKVGSTPMLGILVNGGYYTNTTVNNPVANICAPPSHNVIMLDYPFPGVTNVQAYPISGGTYPTVFNTAVYWNYPNYSPSGTIRVSYDLPCQSVVQYITFYNTCSSFSFRAHLNPANTELTIVPNGPTNEDLEKELLEAKQRFPDLDLSKLPGKYTAPGNENILVQIFNDHGIVLRSIEFDKNAKVSINVANLPDGVYRLHILKGRSLDEHQIVIKR